MRPILVLLAAKLYNEICPATLHAAVALELLHTASLVHDDVVDESTERRGQLSVNAVFNNKVAVLTGDYLLATALVEVGMTRNYGAGSVVLRNLPANCTAVGVPAEVVRINNKAVNPADDLDQQDLPDIVSQRLTDLDRRLSQLEKAAQGDIPPTAAQIAARQRK